MPQGRKQDGGTDQSRRRAIEKGATAVDNARSGIENRIKDIEAKMAELGSFWSGDAAVSFNALMSSWQEKATSLNNILIDLFG